MTNTALLIPHYNDPNGLRVSISSIGSLENIDIIIVDDGSNTLFSENNIRSAFKGSGEIFFIYLQSNQGIETALNTGLDFIHKKKYLFIARLDSGDTVHPQRFKKQTEYLSCNHDIQLVGSYVDVVHSKSRKSLYKLLFPVDDKALRKKMFLNTMFMHPAVMFKSDIINQVGFYPLNYKTAEDYAYFFKMLQYGKGATIPEFLTYYELNENGISLKNRRKQVTTRIRIIKDNFYFGFFPIFGLIRNYLLLILPFKVINQLKKILLK